MSQCSQRDPISSPFDHVVYVTYPRTLVINSEIAVASPQYLGTRGTPLSVGELAEHNCIIGYTGSKALCRELP